MTYTLAVTNAEAIKHIAFVYLSDEMVVLDPTYGKGKFWEWDYNFTLVTTDILPVADTVADFRCLPFKDETFDAAVFDPPYYGHGAQTKKDFGASRQNVWFLRKSEPIRNLYMKGLLELSRVVKNKGILIVKCTSGCDYPRMDDWLVGLGIGRYLDVVIRTNPSLRAWTPNKGPQHKLRTCHSQFLVLRNAHYGRTL